ncbi:MAG: hypothetical protein EON58_11175 [Alphaproteobacteria bacterium]|nr:MAG: hypothetical protein EON58_11175 [Alphaproteobacteria bacterium]
MLRIEYRKLHRPNGLIDDFVIYGLPIDYLAFAAILEAAINSQKAETVRTASLIQIEILSDSEQTELFTSLQNRDDFYSSMADWEQRNILRIFGDRAVLEAFRLFLIDLSVRGDGYSYISEFSKEFGYSTSSPQWRFHIQPT